ncbi:uncharacterized protein LOC104356805 isoform X2 [Tyto alba]|uniref:uncharacterized protein LOC104356805 isoform X2 n=1 Tax=Tyto alba TaxID=56313 RepID=UPI001C680BE8|nr:uncharacterized protein LOC104356805 isoform X2 [Tyto alba]
MLTRSSSMTGWKPSDMTTSSFISDSKMEGMDTKCLRAHLDMKEGTSALQSEVSTNSEEREQLYGKQVTPADIELEKMRGMLRRAGRGEARRSRHNTLRAQHRVGAAPAEQNPQRAGRSPAPGAAGGTRGHRAGTSTPPASAAPSACQRAPGRPRGREGRAGPGFRDRLGAGGVTAEGQRPAGQGSEGQRNLGELRSNAGVSTTRGTLSSSGQNTLTVLKWKQQSEPQDMFQKGGLLGINSPFEESWVNSAKRLVVWSFDRLLPSSQIWVTFVCSFILQRSMQTFIFYK